MSYNPSADRGGEGYGSAGVSSEAGYARDNNPGRRRDLNEALTLGHMELRPDAHASASFQGQQHQPQPKGDSEMGGRHIYPMASHEQVHRPIHTQRTEGAQLQQQYQQQYRQAPAVSYGTGLEQDQSRHGKQAIGNSSAASAFNMRADTVQSYSSGIHRVHGNDTSSSSMQGGGSAPKVGPYSSSSSGDPETNSNPEGHRSYGQYHSETMARYS
jgi:hypothetical protein